MEGSAYGILRKSTKKFVIMVVLKKVLTSLLLSKNKYLSTYI